ncbi:energy transducer TonB [Flavobacterium sp.]|uniref:energy transducer TonB n=1 Tax=Flavobacterium sp. TaxID=239 RepID=UPI00261207DB|nr:energy transducer TonB [Flavobacterium sp.]
MDISLNKDQQKSVGLTILTLALLLLILFFVRFWPPANLNLLGGGGGGGIEMNFGDSDYGLGENYKSEVLNVKDEAKQAPTATASKEDNIITADDAEEDVIAMPKNEKVKKPTPVVEKVVTKPVVVEKPKVSKNTNDALANLLNSNKGGDGNDKTGGNKGRPDGSLSSSGYSGSGSGSGSGTGSGSGNGSGSGSGNGSGSGSGSGNGKGPGYFLGSRKALSKPVPNYTCNEEGKVAVQITVDKSGNVMAAKPGVRGTTNAAKCLLEEAKNAAMRTRWEADNNAPETQVGLIIYSFSLN